MPSAALHPYPWQRVPRLSQRIRYGQSEQAHRELDVLLAEFEQEHGRALGPLRLRCGMVLSYCLRGARQGGAPGEVVMDQTMHAIDRMARTRSWPAVGRLMHEFIDQMLALVVRRERTRIERVIAQIQHDLDSDPASAQTLRQYADGAKLHADYLSRRFRMAAGQTFCQARRAARLSRARRLLLASPSMKVREVARRVGMMDQSQFIRDFRDEYGMTPHQYRLSAAD